MMEQRKKIFKYVKQHKVRVLDIGAGHGYIADWLEVFFKGKELSENNEGNFDGMKVHSSGNIFTSGPGGLLIISPTEFLAIRAACISEGRPAVWENHLSNQLILLGPTLAIGLNYTPNPISFKNRQKTEFKAKKLRRYDVSMSYFPKKTINL